MFGLKERPFFAHVLIVFGAILIIKTLIFFTLQNFSGYFRFGHFGYHQNLVITPLLGLFLNIRSMHIGPREFARSIFSAFLSFFNKIQDGRQNPMSLSRA